MKLIQITLLSSIFLGACTPKQPNAQPPELESLKNTVWHGSTKNQSVGGTGKTTLTIEKVYNDGGITGIVIIEAPLVGSGRLAGNYNQVNGAINFTLTPSSGKGAQIHFYGKIAGGNASGSYSVGAYKNLNAQKGNFSVNFRQKSEVSIDAVKKYLPKRVKEELLTWTPKTQRAKKQYSNHTYRKPTSNLNWEEMNRNRNLERQADALEEQTRIMRREDTRRLLERGF